MFYDRLTRFLHFFIAIGVVAQLLLSEWMYHPRPNRDGDLLYEFHEKIGIILMGLVILYWIWTFVRQGGVPFGQLFPWFSASRRKALFDDIRLYLSHMLRLTLPGTEEPSPLANAIQGLGMLIATGMAATGTVIFLFVPESWQVPVWVRPVFEIHEILANGMWAYLIVHVVATFAHQILGHGVLFPMLFFWRKSPDEAREEAREEA